MPQRAPAQAVTVEEVAAVRTETTGNETDSQFDEQASESEVCDGDNERKCRCQGIDVKLLDKLRWSHPGATGTKNEMDCLSILRKMIESHPSETKLEHVCHRHLHAIAGRLGLQVKKLTTSELRNRLQVCWAFRTQLSILKTHPEYALWFRLASRPSVEADKHGVYARRQVRFDLEPMLSPDQKKLIVEEIGGPGAWEQWHKDGNLIVPGLFSWLWEGVSVKDEFEEGIGALIDDEFTLYRFHLTERNGQPNRGWLRTMYYSLTQQIIRQDLSYWMLYACLRPDGNLRLISYPYYAKFAVPGESTYFRHIDMYMPKYLENGHGGMIIQGSVSLDNEDENGCTELVPGFQNHIKTW